MSVPVDGCFVDMIVRSSGIEADDEVGYTVNVRETDCPMSSPPVAS